MRVKVGTVTCEECNGTGRIKDEYCVECDGCGSYTEYRTVRDGWLFLPANEELINPAHIISISKGYLNPVSGQSYPEYYSVVLDAPTIEGWGALTKPVSASQDIDALKQWMRGDA